MNSTVYGTVGGEPLEGKVTALGVTGSIAAYKAAMIASGLRQLHAEVPVVMSPSATGFVTPMTFRGLTGQQPYTNVADAYASFGGEPHVSIARKLDAYVIAPLTGTTLAQLVTGLDGSNPVALTFRACPNDKPVIVAPAMDSNMWEDPAVRGNIHALRERGVTVVGPENGHLASGAEGSGRMSEPETIIEVLRYSLAQRGGPLLGLKVVITAGPTREWLDSVRFITNSSTGLMA